MKGSASVSGAAPGGRHDAKNFKRVVARILRLSSNQNVPQENHVTTKTITDLRLRLTFARGFPYKLFYSVEGKRVIVFRILHAKGNTSGSFEFTARLLIDAMPAVH